MVFRTPDTNQAFWATPVAAIPTNSITPPIIPPWVLPFIVIVFINDGVPLAPDTNARQNSQTFILIIYNI